MATPHPDPANGAAGRGIPATRRLRADDQAIALECDLSGDQEITTEDLDAIARLLGDDLKAFLSGS